VGKVYHIHNLTVYERKSHLAEWPSSLEYIYSNHAHLKKFVALHAIQLKTVLLLAGNRGMVMWNHWR